MNIPQLHPATGECCSPPLGGEEKDQEMIRLRRASVTAFVRLVTPSLDYMLLTWDLMVDGLTVSLQAI